MTYAIVKIQGKQYRVSPGDNIFVDRLDAKVEDKLTLSDVLLYVDGDKREVGKPLTEYQVEASVKNQTKGEKIRVATYKAKSRSRKVRGHRQHLTQLTIDKISPTSKTSSTKNAAPAKK